MVWGLLALQRLRLPILAAFLLPSKTDEIRGSTRETLRETRELLAFDGKAWADQGKKIINVELKIECIWFVN